MQPLRLGLIGYGHWAREAYVPTIDTLDGVEVVAVAARSETTRRLACEQLGADVATTGDYHAVVADQAVDAVLVAVPNALHREVAEAALAQGKHLFLELPVALSREDVRAVLAAAGASDRVVQFDFELRYMPVAQRLSAIVERGEIGRPLSASVELNCNWGLGGADFSEPTARDGFYLWVGAWYLDMLDVMLGGREPTGAVVRGGRAMNGPLLDHGHALLEYEGGAIGRFSHSLVCPREGTCVSGHLVAEGGEIVVDFESGALTKHLPGRPAEEERHPPKQPVFAWAGIRESIESFLLAIRERTPVAADGEVARRVHEAAFMCHQAEGQLRAEHGA